MLKGHSYFTSTHYHNFIVPDAEALLSRSPPAADKYLPEWTNRNFHSGHLAETERLAAERLLQETQDLIQNARYIMHDYNVI